MDTEKSSVISSPVEIIWGPAMRKGRLPQGGSSAAISSEKLESDSTLVTVPPPLAKKIPLPPLSSVAQPPANGNLPFKKTSFLFLALGLMVLGILFFLAGFFFSVWLHKRPDNGVFHSKVMTKSPQEGSLISSDMSKKILAGALVALPANISKNGGNYADIAPVVSEILKQTLGKGEGEENSSTDSLPEDSLAKIPEQSYTIQLGTFVTQENADDLVKKLEERKISAQVQKEVDDKGASLFCVRTADEFSSYEAAESAAHSLFEQESISAFAIPIVKPKENKTKDA